MGLFVDFDNLDFHSLTNCQDFRRVVDAAPGHISDVQQTVNTAQIHKGTVFCDVFHHTVHTVAFGQFADHFSALFGT